MRRPFNTVVDPAHSPAPRRRAPRSGDRAFYVILLSVGALWACCTSMVLREGPTLPSRAAHATLEDPSRAPHATLEDPSRAAHATLEGPSRAPRATLEGRAGAALSPPALERALKAGRARARLLAAARARNISPQVVIDAWLEREGLRENVRADILEVALLSRARRARGHRLVTEAASAAGKLGALKAALLEAPHLRYNRDYSSIVDYLFRNRLQCASGTLMVQLVWLTAGIAREHPAHRPVFVHTAGHVQPGLLHGTRLHMAEATARDAHVHSQPLSALEGVRVTDVVLELATTVLGADAPRWLRQKALLHEAPPTPAGRPAAHGGSLPFAFGDAEVPPGDLPLPQVTPPGRVDYARPVGTVTFAAPASPGQKRRPRTQAQGGRVLADLLADWQGSLDTRAGRSLNNQALARADVDAILAAARGGRREEGATCAGLRPWSLLPKRMQRQLGPAVRALAGPEPTRPVGIKVAGSCAVAVNWSTCAEDRGRCQAVLLARRGGRWVQLQRGALGELVGQACAAQVGLPWEHCPNLH